MLETHVSQATHADRGEMAARRPEPLRLLVLGQTSVGKSSLVNALLRETRALVDALPATGEFTPYELTQNGLDRALLIDTPGLGAGADLGILDEAMDADLVLWVCSAARADREADRLALQAFRERFDARLDRRRPPVLPVLTHIDRLRPFKEWNPPYDLRNPTTEKAQAIKAAMAVVAADLGFGVDDVIPVALSGPAEAYNIDALGRASPTCCRPRSKPSCTAAARCLPPLGLVPRSETGWERRPCAHADPDQLTATAALLARPSAPRPRPDLSI